MRSKSLTSDKVPLDIKSVEYTIGFENQDPIPIVHIIGRTQGGSRVHLKYDKQRSYFYVPASEFDQELKDSDEVKKWEKGFESIYGDHLVKVYTRIPPEVPRLRDDYTHYEADIPFPLRFMIDNNITNGLMVPKSYIKNENENIPLDLCEPADTSIDSRFCFCDIEVDDENGFPQADKADEEVICITAYDNYLERYDIFLYHPELPDITSDKGKVRIWETEEEMMEGFVRYLKTTKPDFLAGWNFEDFDARYLLNRLSKIADRDEDFEFEADDIAPLGKATARKWGVEYKGLEVFDMLEAYKMMKFTELDSYSLEDVTQEEIGEGKIKDERSFREQWENDTQQLIDYNIRDVELLVDLEEAEGIIKFYEEMSDFVGWTASNVIRSAQSVDCFILRKAHGEYVLPSKETAKEKTEEFEGATVFPPSTGIKDNVIVLDLKSLYPMTIKTINAGPETKKEDGKFKAPNGVRFQEEPRSIVADMIDELLDEREDKKAQRDQYKPGDKRYEVLDRQQAAIKVVMNTIYGVMGSDTSRVGDKDTGGAVTSAARGVIGYTKEVAESKGFNAIYGDTDSVMIELGSDFSQEECIEIGHKLEEVINKAYDKFAKEELNASEHWFEVEFEKLYKKFLQSGKKKRYAGHITWKEGKETDDIDITGFEYKRSDYCEVAKETQKEVFYLILKGHTLSEVSQYVRERVARIREADFPLDDLGIPGSYGGPPSSYDAPTLHSRGGKYTNDYLHEDITQGDRPKGMYVKKIESDSDGGTKYPWPSRWNTDPNKGLQPFICWMNHKMIPDEIVFDWDKLIEKQIKNPIDRLLEGTEWSWGEVISGKRQRKLGNGEYDGDEPSGEETLVKIKKDDEEEISEDFDREDMEDWEIEEMEARKMLKETQEMLDGFEEPEEDEEEVKANMKTPESGTQSLDIYL